jgi:hypothetical protein
MVRIYAMPDSLSTPMGVRLAWLKVARRRPRLGST